MTNDGAYNLLEGIMTQAVTDYAKASVNIKRGRGTPGDERRLYDVTSFINSDWFAKISPLPPEIMFRACEYRAEQKLDAYNAKHRRVQN